MWPTSKPRLPVMWIQRLWTARVLDNGVMNTPKDLIGGMEPGKLLSRARSDRRRRWPPSKASTRLQLYQLPRRSMPAERRNKPKQRGPKKSVNNVMANETEESDKMKNEEIPVPPMVGKSLREVLAEVRAKDEAHRRSATSAASKLASKAPAWAQRIWKFEQTSAKFCRLFVETEEFAKTKGFKISPSWRGGHNLHDERKLVLRGRPLFAIVQHFGADNIWKDF